MHRNNFLTSLLLTSNFLAADDSVDEFLPFLHFQMDLGPKIGQKLCIAGRFYLFYPWLENVVINFDRSSDLADCSALKMLKKEVNIKKKSIKKK